MAKKNYLARLVEGHVLYFLERQKTRVTQIGCCTKKSLDFFCGIWNIHADIL